MTQQNGDIGQTDGGKNHKVTLQAATEQSVPAIARRFSSRTTHDLKQPLAALRLLLQQVPHIDDVDKKAAALDMAVHSVDALQGHIDSLLQAAQLLGGKVECQIQQFPLSSVFSAIESDFQERFSKKGVEFEVTGQDCELTSDPVLLFDLLSQLVGNAYEHTQCGRVELGAARRGDCVECFVRDTGDGNSADEIERWGEPFWQDNSSTRSFKAGLGLGLFSSGLLARQLKSELVLNSNRGIGTTVVLSLPI